MAKSLVKYSYNGTEYSFVSKVPAQIEDLKCPICLELVYEPVMTSCDHFFCQRCVRGHKKCPTCQSCLKCKRNQRVERKVKKLKVKCPNSEKGCGWQGDLGDAAQHTGTNCQMEAVLCPRGCKEKIVRGHLKDHATACTQSTYKCPHCWFEDSFTNVTTTHFTSCKDFPLGCPAGCHSILSRCKMAIHLSDCAEELVPCKYAAIGCDEVLKRKDLQTHLRDKKDYHLERSMDMVMQLSMGQAELSLSLKSMEARGVSHDTSHLPLPFRPWLQNTPTCYPCPPWVIKMEGFLEKKKYNMQWYSDPVYSHFGGYKMCLRVDANGNRIGGGKDTHVSVFAYLMQGDKDDNLKWPFKGTIKVSLLNQLEDGQHHTKSPWTSFNDRITEQERASGGQGLDQFVSHQDLDYNCQYLKDDTLFFRVDYIELNLGQIWHVLHM